jgi:hypothetical protein
VGNQSLRHNNVPVSVRGSWHASRRH